MRTQPEDSSHEATLSRRNPGGGEMLSAFELSLMLYLLHTADGKVEMPNGSGGFVPVPSPVRDLLIAALNRLSNGDRLPLPPLDPMITVEQASGIMEVSRAELNGMLDKEMIPHVSDGAHRRLARADVLTYLGREISRQREATAAASNRVRGVGPSTPSDSPGPIATHGNL